MKKAFLITLMTLSMLLCSAFDVNAVCNPKEAMDSTVYMAPEYVEGTDTIVDLLIIDENGAITIVSPTDTSSADKNDFVSVAMVEHMPEYLGGESAMYKFISDNLAFPEVCYKSRIKGRVVVSFIVGKDGSVENVNMEDALYPAVDREIMRVFYMMPKWKPGYNNGKPVRVKYSLPMTINCADW